MKERKIKKTMGDSTRQRKPPNPPQIGVPWGRAASEHRPGLFTRQYLTEHGEGCCADVFYALRRNLEAINKERIEIGDKPIRGCTYNSFAKYWHWFKLLGLVEPVDKREAPIYDFLEDKRFFRLTDKGTAEVRAWEDPIAVTHPELR
ncbi:MAG: hypothetical protein R6V59_09420 [Dehalococcoidia bacterium]